MAVVEKQIHMTLIKKELVTFLTSAVRSSSPVREDGKATRNTLLLSAQCSSTD